MGLFSSSYKYEAYAGSSALFEENPQSLKDSIFHSAIAGSSMSMAVKYALTTDLYSRARGAIKYAAKITDGYIRGLPEGDQTAITLPEAVLIDAIESDIGETLNEIVTQIVGTPKETFMVAQHLQTVYEDPAYFPWSIAPDNPVWHEERETIEIPVIDPSTSKYYVVENSPIYERVGYAGIYDYDALQDLPPEEYATLPYHSLYLSEYKISFAYTDNLGNPAIWEMIPVLDLTSYDTGKWIQVRYRSETDLDTIRYWLYLIGSNEDPGLEASIQENVALSSFMPVIVMMQDKVWYDGDYDYSIDYDLRPEKTPLHASTDKILKNFSIKGRDVKEDYLEQKAEDDASGDSKKSDAEEWDFFIHFAVPIQSEVRGAREYLFEFFLEMEKNQQYSFEEYQAYLATPKDGPKKGYYAPQPVDELHITEAGVNGYNVTYGWSYIYSETFEGKYYENTIIKKYHSNGVQRRENNEAEYRSYLEYLHGEGILIGKVNRPPANGKLYDQDDANGYHDYYFVVQENYDIETDTWSHTCVVVVGLSMIYTINTREESDKSYRFRYAEMGMFNFDEDGDRTEEFRIPIHIGSLMNVSRVHREEALGAGMCATVFLVQKIKVSWYQKGFFKWLIVIIAVILIALSIYYAAGAGTETLLSVIASALGATGAMAVLVYVVLSFAMGMIFALASQTISEEFGSTAGMLFMIIATVVSMQGAGTVGGASGKAMSAFASAASMVTTVATYANMAVQVYSTYALAEMQEEMQDFLQTADEKYEAIQDAWDNIGFGEGADIDPLDLYRSLQAAVTEAPDTYYARTLNANPGLLGYDLINHFHAIALNLPSDANSVNIIDSMMDSFSRQRGMA